MDTNPSPGFPPESNRVSVIERLSNDRSSYDSPKPGGGLGALISSWGMQELVRGLNLRLFVIAIVGVVSLIASISWWSSQSETLNEAAIPTATPSTPTALVSPASQKVPVESDDEIVIHVAGAVTDPGVISVENGGRVIDAIEAAGGPTPDADLHSLNLAQILQDGTSVVVPVVGRPSSGPAIRPPSVSAGGTGAPSSLTQININVASVDELQKLDGVGPSTAASIVKWRETNGAFVSVDDLLAVPGIGPAKLEAMRDDIVV